MIYENLNEKLDWSHLLAIMENGDDSNLIRYLEQSNVKITTLVDDKGFSLLHHAVLKQREEKIQTLINFTKT